MPSGHCHHLSVECLTLAPTGKSYPPLRQEMQEAFRPERDRVKTSLLSFSAMRKKVSKERIAPLRFSFILIPYSLQVGILQTLF